MASEVRARRPTRIILVRHGQSEGNLDESKYCTIADSKIMLTAAGMEEAEACGKSIRRLIEKDVKGDDWQVYFYVSPYKRTLCTLKGIGRAFERERILGVREEPRLREQDFGNFQEEKRMAVIKEMRNQFGRFFFRFPEGESGADVFDRVTSFLESLWRDIETYRLNRSESTDLNLVIVFHGLTMRIFLMRWFKWTVQQFEQLNNPRNCEVRVMQLGAGGEYSLAVHHSREELERWGLTPDMITEQEWRAKAERGQWYPDWPWCGAFFFDHFLDGSAAAAAPTNDNSNPSLIAIQSCDRPCCLTNNSAEKGHCATTDDDDKQGHCATTDGYECDCATHVIERVTAATLDNKIGNS